MTRQRVLNHGKVEAKFHTRRPSVGDTRVGVDFTAISSQAI